MLEHRQATDGRNPFCASPLTIQWGRLRRFTFYFLRDGLSKFRAYTPLRGKASFFLSSRGHHGARALGTVCLLPTPPVIGVKQIRGPSGDYWYLHFRLAEDVLMSEPRAASVPSVFVCRSVSPSPRVPLRFRLSMKPLNYYYYSTTTSARSTVVSYER